MAFALVIVALIIWRSITVFLLGFASVLFAVFLHMISRALCRLTKLPYQLMLAIVIFALAAICTALFWISTPLISDQLSQLFEDLPEAYTKFRDYSRTLFNSQLITETDITRELASINGKLFSQIKELFSFTIGTIVGFIVFLVVGFYLSLNPTLYIQGFLKMIPTEKREHVDHILSKIGQALRWWLIGKVIAMFAIGLLTIIGLWILRIPLAFILGLLSGALTFIPYIGPILAAIPGILIGLSISPLKGLYVTLIYILVHALEGYLITPYVEQKVVSLPPALTILSQILFVILVGFIGLALASPLLVLIFVVIDQTWIRGYVAKKRDSTHALQ